MDANRQPSRDRLTVDVSLLIVRLIVGLIFAVHGYMKLFGTADGGGIADTAAKMGPMAYPVSVGEFFGGLGIMFGFLSRFSAASNIVIMIGAIALVHGANGFLLSKGGFEYNLALIGLLMPVLLLGPGAYSIGRFLPLPRSPQTGRPVIVLE